MELMSTIRNTATAPTIEKLCQCGKVVRLQLQDGLDPNAIMSRVRQSIRNAAGSEMVCARQWQTHKMIFIPSSDRGRNVCISFNGLDNRPVGALGDSISEGLPTLGVEFCGRGCASPLRG
jgi:hypothetical protein